MPKATSPTTNRVTAGSRRSRCASATAPYQRHAASATAAAASSSAPSSIPGRPANPCTSAWPSSPPVYLSWSVSATCPSANSATAAPQSNGGARPPDRISHASASSAAPSATANASRPTSASRSPMSQLFSSSTITSPNTSNSRAVRVARRDAGAGDDAGPRSPSAPANAASRYASRVACSTGRYSSSRPP